jgi:hypothetical protein
MNFYIVEDGIAKGPCSVEEVVRLCRKGRLKLSDLAWREGISEWRPLHSMPDVVNLVVPPAPSAIGIEPITRSKAEVKPGDPISEQKDSGLESAPTTQLPKTLKCDYCGAEYPEGTLECSLDNSPLKTKSSDTKADQTLKPTGNSPGASFWNGLRAFALLGVGLALLWGFFASIDPDSRNLLFRLIRVFSWIFSRGRVHE